MTEPTLRTSAEMLDRMETLLRRMASVVLSNGAISAIGEKDTLMYAPIDHYAEARSIVAMLPDPVDPDIQMARDVAADAHDQKTAIPDYLTFMRSGAYDDEPVVIAALAGIKRGRELASA